MYIRNYNNEDVISVNHYLKYNKHTKVNNLQDILIFVEVTPV